MGKYDIMELGPFGSMIFLNNHVIGISWLYTRGCKA